ncbi:hypothetical protein MNBD_GAMMA12-827 [hydrothermal vent metagenome]|uniref:Right handed beta helix domain-containing protein n=1 Tax=hydrothermal vent metagenome TaxID=652676 RepID=A0A3B0YXE9_9ZZZZ
MQIVPNNRGSVKSVAQPTLRVVPLITLFVIALTVLFHASANAKVYKPRPEVNLSDLSVRLKTGDVVKLGPHRYYGQLLVEKKSISVHGAANGKTTLYDPAIQTLVFVGAGGSIELTNVRFKLGGRSQTAMHIKGGKAVVRSCVIKRSKKQPIYVENGELEVHQCRFSDIGEEVISANGTSKVLIQGSTFTNIKSKAVVIQSNSQATIRKSSFSNIGSIAVLALEKSKVYVVSSEFSDIKNTAMQAEQDSEVSVALSSFSNISNFGLIAVKQSIVRVKNSKFKNCKGIAVVGNKATEISVADSRFNNVEQIVFVGKQGTHVSVSGNRINNAAKTKTAIAVESADSVLISKNLLLNVGEGISVNGSGGNSLVVENNTVVNSARSALSFSVAAGAQRASVLSNRFINSRKSAVLLGNKANVNFSKNIVLARTTVAVYVRNNASIQFSDNVVYGVDKSILFHSSASPESRLSRNMLISIILKSARHAEIIPDSQFSYLTANAENKRILTADINKLLQTADTVNTFADIARVNSDIQNLQSRIANLKSQVGQLSSLTVKATDVAGREFVPSYTVYNVYNAIVSRHTANNPVAAVPPGDYYIKSDIGDRAKKEITLVAGQSGKITITAPKYRVLGLMNFDAKKGWTTSWVPFLFHRTSQLRSNFTTQQYHWASRRSNTTVTDLVAALDQVRAKLPNLRSEYSRIASQYKKSSTGSAKKKLARWDNAISWAHNVLAVAGTEVDAKQLVNLATRVPELRVKRLALAAYIEKRLGILGKASIVAALKSTNASTQVNAALLLRHFGRAEGDVVLARTVAAAINSKVTANSATVLLSVNKPEILAAMRQVVQAFVKQRQAVELAKSGKVTYPKHLWNAAATASIYLYTWGNSDDAQLAAKLTYRKSQLIALARLVSDPRALADFYLGFRGSNKIIYDPHWVAKLCEGLNYLPSSSLSQFDSYFEGLLVKAATSNRISKKSRLIDISLARAQYNVAKSACRANTVTASLVYKQKTALLANTPWIEKSWLFNKNARQLKQGNPFAAVALDHAAHGILVGSLSTVRNNEKLRYPDLFLAYHNIATRHCQSDRCAFVMNHNKAPKGALSGILHLRSVKPTSRGLTVNFTLDLAAYHANASATTAGTPVSFGKYMAFGGRDLVAEVYVKNAGRKIRLRKVAKGSILKYSMSSAKFNVNNAYLYIRVRLFNEWREFGFPLFLYRR